MSEANIESLADLAMIATALVDAFGTHVSIYLTIISAYLITSYLVAEKLTRLQISIATGVFIVAYAFQSLLLVATALRINSVTTRMAQLNSDLGLGIATQYGLMEIGAVVLIAGLIAPLWFMVSVRRGDKR